MYSFSIVHRMIEPAMTGTPYVVALVDLLEGARIMTNIVGCPTTDVRVAMSVEVQFERVSDTIAVPVFAPSRPPGRPEGGKE